MAKKYYPVGSHAGLQGPFNLTTQTARNAPGGAGAYILSWVAGDGTYLACYIGRAESLTRRLQQHASQGAYAWFFYKETATANGAFFTECRWFHEYGKAAVLDNEIHPAIPAGSSLPQCAESGCNGEAY